MIQSAQFNRCHAETTPAGHETRPHIHLSFPAGTTCQHHAEHPAHSDAPPPADQPEEHDDAISIVTDVLLSRGSTELVGDPAMGWSVAQAIPVVDIQLGPVEVVVSWSHPPPAPDCPRYLQLLTLLI